MVPSQFDAYRDDLRMRVRNAVAGTRGEAGAGGYGLRGIRERVHALGGRVSVQQSSNAHVLEIRVPVDGEGES